MQYKSKTFSPVTLDADGISTSQTPAAGGAQNLTITGALASGGSVTLSTPSHVTITSVADESSRTFTVTGTDRDGVALTEAITGANAGTAVGTKNFLTITQIQVDNDTTGAVTAGVDGSLEGAWIPLDMYAGKLSVRCEISSGGGKTYGLEHTISNPQDSTFDEHAANPFAHGTVASETTSQSGIVDDLFPAFRVDVSAFTSGTLTVWWAQERIGAFR